MESNYFKQEVKDFLKTTEQTDKDKLEELSLYVYSDEAKDSDLYMLARLLPEEYVERLVDYFDGAKVQFPTKEELYKCKLIAVTFYLHHIKGVKWKDIQKMIKYPEKDVELLNPVSLGKKLAKLKKKIYSSKYIEEMIKDLDLGDIRKLLQDIK